MFHLFFFILLNNMHFISIDKLLLHLLRIYFFELRLDLFLGLEFVAIVIIVVTFVADNDILAHIASNLLFLRIIQFLFFLFVRFDSFGVPVSRFEQVVVLYIVIDPFSDLDRLLLLEYLFTRSVGILPYSWLFTIFFDLGLFGLLFPKYVMTLVGRMDSCLAGFKVGLLARVEQV